MADASDRPVAGYGLGRGARFGRGGTGPRVYDTNATPDNLTHRGMMPRPLRAPPPSLPSVFSTGFGGLPSYDDAGEEVAGSDHEGLDEAGLGDSLPATTGQELEGDQPMGADEPSFRLQKEDASPFDDLEMDLPEIENLPDLRGQACQISGRKHLPRSTHLAFRRDWAGLRREHRSRAKGISPCVVGHCD